MPHLPGPWFDGLLLAVPPARITAVASPERAVRILGGETPALHPSDFNNPQPRAQRNLHVLDCHGSPAPHTDNRSPVHRRLNITTLYKVLSFLCFVFLSSMFGWVVFFCLLVYLAFFT